MVQFNVPVGIPGTVVGESLDCLMLSGTVVRENLDHIGRGVAITFLLNWLTINYVLLISE